MIDNNNDNHRIVINSTINSNNSLKGCTHVVFYYMFNSSYKYKYVYRSMCADE